MPQYNQHALRANSVSEVTSTIPKGLALGTTVREGTANYIFVYNGSTNEQVTTGRIPMYASASSQYTVDVAAPAASTALIGTPAGVCVHATIPTANYGWLMTHGFADVENFGATSVVQTNRIYLTTSGTVGIVNSSPTTVSNWAGFANTFGQAVENQDTTTTGTFKAKVSIPE